MQYCSTKNIGQIDYLGMNIITKHINISNLLKFKRKPLIHCGPFCHMWASAQGPAGTARFPHTPEGNKATPRGSTGRAEPSLRGTTPPLSPEPARRPGTSPRPLPRRPAAGRTLASLTAARCAPAPPRPPAPCAARTAPARPGPGDAASPRPTAAHLLVALGARFGGHLHSLGSTRGGGGGSGSSPRTSAARPPPAVSQPRLRRRWVRARPRGRAEPACEGAEPACEGRGLRVRGRGAPRCVRAPCHQAPRSNPPHAGPGALPDSHVS